MGWKKDTKKAAKSGGGLSKKEAKKIAQKYQGVNKSAVKSFAAGLPSFSSSPSNDPPPPPPPDFNTQVFSDTGKYPFQWQFEHQIGLANLEGGYATQQAGIYAGATTASASIKAEADKEVAKAYADAQKYGKELDLQGTKYTADKISEWQQAVANIEVKGKLDLQPIINAGLEKVAGIQSEAQKAVAETTGKYGLASTKEQTASAEKLGKMELAGSLYGLLGSMFG